MSLKNIFPSFPFEIAFPARVKVYDWQDVAYYVNKWNGIKRLYYSLYSVSEDAVLDKVWFDFDSHKAYDIVLKFHDWLKSKNVKHSVVFSGGGFHLYIFIKPVKLDRNTLYQAHWHFINALGLKVISDPHESDVDSHILGDVRRVATIPGTFNIRRKRFAIALTEDELMSGLDKIQDLAKHTQRFEVPVIGNELYVLENVSNSAVKTANIELPAVNIDLPATDELKMFPPCVQAILLNVNELGDWRGRWYATTFMVEMGLTDDQIDALAKKYFGKVKRSDRLGTNYDHWKRVKVLEYVKRNGNVSMSCNQMMMEGRCPGKCKWYRG